MAQNIIVSIFEVESEAYQAFTMLRNEPFTDESFLYQAVLVKKDNGTIQALDYFDTGAETADNTAIGGILGAFMGIIAGPFGMLLGAGYGMLVGRNVDLMDSLENMSLVEQIIGKLQNGDVAIIGLADEDDEAVLDGKLGAFKTITARFDAAVVAEEVEEAIKAEKDLEHQARAALRKEKSEDFKNRVEERRKELKAQFKTMGQNVDLDVRY